MNQSKKKHEFLNNVIYGTCITGIVCMICKIAIYTIQTYLQKENPFVSGCIYLGSIAITIYTYISYLINKKYKTLTGRNYNVDHHLYKRSFKQLVTFFQDSDPYKINEAALPNEDWKTAEGIILGKSGSHLIKRESSGVGNLALFSLPGGGKTTSQIIPSALRFDGSVLAIDIKGDILHYTKSNRPIKIFAPENPAISCHYNPLDGIDKLSISDRKVFIEQLASVIIPEEPNGKYFTDGGRDFFCGISLFLLAADIQTAFPKILKQILQGNAFDWVKEIIAGDCDEAKEYLASYMGSNEKNVAGCYNMLCKCIRPFNSGSLAQLLNASGDCITPQTLEQGFDIYIELPQDKINIYTPISTIIIQSFMSAFMKRPDKSSGENRRPILFLLDEFPQLQFDFSTLSAGLSTLRSKGVTLFLAQQSIAQLEKRYGETGCREIIDTCAYISVMSAQDPKSRRFFQELIGTKKILKINQTQNETGTSSKSIQEAREYIFQPEDFGNLNDKVIIIANGKYIMADKTYCFK